MDDSVVVRSPSSVSGTGGTIFTVGTLHYDKRQLWMLFFWLMWNDFTIMLMEQVTGLNAVLMKDRMASNTLISAFGTAGGILGMWINPCFSTWSDRLRTRFGRRRPYLFFSVPFFAASLMAIPYMPDFYHFWMRFGWAASILNLIPINGEILFIGIASVINGLFNGVVLAIFSYLYWDVVPEVVLGRFNSMAKIVTVAAGLIWSFFIVGMAEHHIKGVYISVSLFCLVVYLLSILKVREGEYPPPEARQSKGFVGPVVAYFRDCFSDSYYLWIFFATLLFQVANQGQLYQFFYMRYDLGMNLETTGWINGMGQMAATVFGLLLGYGIGSFIDRFKPIRVIPVVFALWALTDVGGYIWVNDKMSGAIFYSVLNIVIFIHGIALGAVTVELFPRSKIGQFCSAQAFFYQTIITFINPILIAPFFDLIKFNRLGFLWSAFFYFLAGVVSLKVYFNWKERMGERTATTALG